MEDNNENLNNDNGFNPEPYVPPVEELANNNPVEETHEEFKPEPMPETPSEPTPSMSSETPNMENSSLTPSEPTALVSPEAPTTSESSYTPSEPEKKDNKKLIYIIAGIALVAVVAVVLILVLGKKDNDKEKEIEDFAKKIENEKKEEEDLNKNYTTVEHILDDKSILIEFVNKNDVLVNATCSVELYDASGNLMDTINEFIFNAPKNIKHYEDIYIPEDKGNYSTYKVKLYLTKAVENVDYLSNAQIVNHNVSDDNILFQVKNNGTEKLDYVFVAALFYDEAGKIIGFKETAVNNVLASDTSSGKIYVPYTSDYTKINYSKYELVVNSVTVGL